jgi:hypothetical protein
LDRLGPPLLFFLLPPERQMIRREDPDYRAQRLAWMVYNVYSAAMLVLYFVTGAGLYLAAGHLLHGHILSAVVAAISAGVAICLTRLLGRILLGVFAAFKVPATYLR